jgi:hypothetical protein
MTRLWPYVVLAMLCCLPAVAWTEQKPLAERVLDTMLERCRVLERTDRKGECESARVGADAPRALHRTMVKQATELFPSDAVCSKHGSFLVCAEKTLDGRSQGSLYRLTPAADGSDSTLLSVWSREW